MRFQRHRASLRSAGGLIITNTHTHLDVFCQRLESESCAWMSRSVFHQRRRSARIDNAEKKLARHNWIDDGGQYRKQALRVCIFVRAPGMKRTVSNGTIYRANNRTQPQSRAPRDPIARVFLGHIARRSQRSSAPAAAASVQLAIWVRMYGSGLSAFGMCVRLYVVSSDKSRAKTRRIRV